jgi:hypothetical protein
MEILFGQLFCMLFSLKKEGNQYANGKAYQCGAYKKDGPGHGNA